ncbi:MAG: hypothetical protein V2A76_12555 [Planctomycetota bacterium]
MTASWTLLSLLLVLHSGQESEQQEPPKSLRGIPDALVNEADERPIAEVRRLFLLPLLEKEILALAREESLLKEDDEPERRKGIEEARGEIDRLLRGLSREPNPSTYSDRTLPLIDLYLYQFAQDHLRFDPIDISLFLAWDEANQRFLESSAPEDREVAARLRKQALESWPTAPALFDLIGALAKGPLSDAERRSVVGKLSVEYPHTYFPAAELLARAGSGGAETGGASGGYTPDPTLPRLDGAEHPAGIVESLSRLYEEVSG